MDRAAIFLENWIKRIEYCKVLDVPTNATEEQIKQAFRQQQRKHHPDKGGDEEMSKLINEAYHFLSHNPRVFPQTFNSQPSKDDDDDTSSAELFFDSSSSDSDSSTEDDDSKKPRLVEQIREEITRARQETKTYFIVDNYFHCFSNIFEQLLSEKETQRECSIFCKICDKSFINQDHHYRIQNIHQYIELLNSGSQMDFFVLLETKLGSDAWMWTPTVINPNEEFMDFFKHYNSIKDRVQDLLQLLQDAIEKFESLKDDEALDLKPSFPQHTYREEVEIDIQSFELKECSEDGFAFPNGYLVEIKQSSLPESIPQELLPLIKIFNGKPKTMSTRLRTTCRNCRWKYNVLTKLYSCRMCRGIHCRKCQVKSVVLQLGYNSQVIICNKCAEQSKLDNAELWATSAHDLLKGNKFQLCKLFLTVSYAYVKTSFQTAPKWREVAELAFAKAQYGLFLQVEEYLHRNNSPDCLIATAKKLASVSEGNLAAACLTDLKLSKDEWIKIAMEFSDLDSYSVAAYCISKAELTEEESLQKSDEIIYSPEDRDWKKAFLFLYKAERNSQDWMKVAEVLLQKQQTKLAFESFRHLDEDTLIKLCNRLGQRNEWENAMMCLLYLSQRHRLKSIPTETDILQYLLWVINEINHEVLLQKASLEITKKNYQDAFTILAFLNFKWNFRNCWKRQSEVAFNKQNIDLAIALGILHHKENRVKDSWLLELGLKLKDFPHKACTCFLMGNYKLEYIAEIYKNKGNHEKCIEYYLKDKNLGKIRNIGQKLLSLELHAAALYYATVIKFLKGLLDSAYKMENLMCIVDELFSPDERKEVYKSFAQNYPEVITQEIGVKIHLMLVQEIKQQILPEDDLKAAELLYAAYHFLPLQLCEPVFSRKLKQNALKIQMKIAADDYDFHTLGNTLSQLTHQNLAIAKEIHDNLLGKKTFEELTSTKKAVLLIIRGSILKIKEQNLNALNHFLLAATTASHYLEEIAECIATLLHDFDFHANLMQGIFKEIEHLASQMRRKSYIDLPYSMFSTDILDRPFAGGVNIRLDDSQEKFLMRKWLHDVQSGITDSVSLAYSCLKLYESMQSNLAKMSVLLTSATYFLQAIQISTFLADKYAYRNAIMKMGEMCTTAANSVATPFFQTIVYQSIFALTISANQLCSLHLNEHDNATRNEKKMKRNLISEKKCQRIKHYLRSIMALGKVNPFINLRHYGLTDTCKMNIAGKLIMQEILKKKTSEQKFNSNLFPLHIYSYWKMIGIWQKWIKDESVIFQSARYNCIKDLLEHKGWTLRQAEKVLEWPLINTNPDGWVNVMEKDLNLNPRVSFSSIGGFSLCLETGEVAMLLEPSENVSDALFTAEDILEVFKCGAAFSFFGLTDCLDEPLINYSPLVAGVYSPKVLKNTNLLKTMTKVDILLKELVTGMELNIQCPFLLRKTTEGILKRLPPQLKKEIEILYGNKRCNKNDSGVSVSRFWMEMGENTNLDIELIKNKMIFKVGDITPNFKRYLMTQNDSGKYIDANPKNTNPNSVDEKFVKFFEKKYNEIGKYFPELLRLKQLQKISIICSCLKSHLFFHKNSGEEIDKKICASIKKLGVEENEEDLMECTDQSQELYWIPTLYFQQFQESDSRRDTIKDLKIFGGISMRGSVQQGTVALSSLCKPYTVNSLMVFAKLAEIGRRNDGDEEQSFVEGMEDQGCGLEIAAKQMLGETCS